jgi:hypothetical protein
VEGGEGVSGRRLGWRGAGDFVLGELRIHEVTVDVHNMTPAAKPREAARKRGLARLAQKTTQAPSPVAAAETMTSPKARPTLPSATICSGVGGNVGAQRSRRGAGPAGFSRDLNGRTCSRAAKKQVSGRPGPGNLEQHTGMPPRLEVNLEVLQNLLNQPAGGEGTLFV